MVREFTRAYQTSDGKVFIDKDEAHRHEQATQMLAAIRSACSEARHDDFGKTFGVDRFQQRLAEELIRVGFALRDEGR